VETAFPRKKLLFVSSKTLVTQNDCTPLLRAS